MDLIEFVANISLEGFEELRKAVVARHQFHAMKIAEIIEYLGTQEALIESIKTSREACEKTLAEKTGAPLSFAVKAVSRFLEVEGIKARVLTQEGEELGADMRSIIGQQNTDRPFE